MTKSGTLPVGTKVILSQQGIETWAGFGFNASNPIDTIGTVMQPKAEWEHTPTKFRNRVVWSNGSYNSYFEGDLDVVVN